MNIRHTGVSDHDWLFCHVHSSSLVTITLRYCIIKMNLLLVANTVYCSAVIRNVRFANIYES